MQEAKRGLRGVRLAALGVTGILLSGLLSACGGSSGSSSSGSVAGSGSGVTTPSGSGSGSTGGGLGPPPTTSGGGTTVTTSGQNVTLGWQPPTENTDGSPLKDLQGYKIHYGTVSQDYTTTIQVSNPGVATYVVQNLPAGSTYYFAVTAYNSAGTESLLSDEVSATLK